MNDKIRIFHKPENVHKLEILFGAFGLTNSEGKESQIENKTMEEKGILNINSDTDLNLLIKNGAFSLELKQLTISVIELNEIPSEVFQLKYLNTLNLSNNLLESLPDDIGKLCNLVVLDLSWNKLSSLPKSLKSIQGLNCLNISHNKFVEIPFILNYALRTINTLDLSHNEIKTFKDPPACVDKLVKLNVSENALNEFPAWTFSSVCHLQVLDISKNQLGFNFKPVNSYNSGISESLQILNVENCNYAVTNIHILSSFKNLQVLKLGNDEFSEGKRKSLNYLGNLTMTPFETLKSITYLYLNNAQIPTLPLDFDYLENIKVLNLSDNLLSWLPECFPNITSLKILNLNSNELLFLPENIGKLVNLEQIHLANNALYRIPKDFQNLHSLEFADFYNNKLEQIDEMIFKGKNLKGIDLGSNYLASAFSGNDVNADQLRNLYDPLKNSFRIVFDVVDCRSDSQVMAPCETSTELSSDMHSVSVCSFESSESEQNPGQERTSEESDQDETSSHPLSQGEGKWGQSPREVEEEELFDPNNDSSYEDPPISSTSELKNYCPGNAHVPSVRNTYLKNFNSVSEEDTKEGQFDSD